MPVDRPWATRAVGVLSALGLLLGCGTADTSGTDGTAGTSEAGEGTTSVSPATTADALPSPSPSSSPSADASAGPPTTSADASPPAGPAEAVTTSDPPTVGVTETTSVPLDGAVLSSPTDATQLVHLRIESRVGDVSTAALTERVLGILNDDRGWPQAGFEFVADANSPFRVVLAEGAEVDALCLPLETYGTVSCQNGPVVALNADRWRGAVDHWDSDVATYRGYLVNHEVGHLLGQRHPRPRCPVAGRPAGVMEQQTAGLEGCVGNPWPRPWEIERAAQRPVVYAPWPDWGPDPVPGNDEAAEPSG